VRAFAPLADGKKQSIDLNLREPLQPALLDRHRIEQVVTNLISNAHKFAAKGGHIEVTLAKDDGNLHMTVRDDGPGIPTDQQERIFDKFYVVTDSRNLAGVGLGLYIARQLVELHGGQIWVESEPGKGCAFHVVLPTEREDPSGL
jgi:two-component system sensor histidine kinase VicK